MIPTNLTYNPQELALYNPSCIKEMETFQKFCLEFKANVIETISTRFKICVIILVVLIFLRMYLYYHKPAFTQTEWYQKRVEYRIDFIIMIVALITIAYLFI